MEKNRNLILLTSLIVIVLLFKYSGFLGSLFEPLDDYALYDDFSDTGYQASSSLETIQIDVCMPNSCGGVADGVDEYGCQKWKDLRTRTLTSARECYGAYYGGNYCYDVARKTRNCPSGYTGKDTCAKDSDCVCTKQESYYEYCGGSSGAETSLGQTINLPEDTKLVMAYCQLPDYNTHTFYVNGEPVSVAKKDMRQHYGTSYNPVATLFQLSNYPNSKMDFGENTIKTDFPITLYVQTGYCENYMSNPCGVSPEGANILPIQWWCTSSTHGSGDRNRRHLQCYYPKWEGRKEELFWYQRSYEGYRSVVIAPAYFKPSLGKIAMYNDVSVKDFKNSDIKIKYTSGGLAIDIVELKENIFYKGIEESVSLPTLASTDQNHIVEILHSKITPGELHIYNDAIYIGNITANFDNFHLKLTNPRTTSIVNQWGVVSGSGVVDYVKYKIPFNCEIFGDEKLVSETYTSGEVIQMDEDFKLNYDGCSIEKFCLGDRALITSSTGTMGDYENEIYQAMARGEPLTVHSDETWDLFFITKKDSSGRCVDFSREEQVFEPVSISTVTDSLTIYPDTFKTFETEHIDLTNMPSVLKATFLIKAVGGGIEQTKDEVIIFKR